MHNQGWIRLSWGEDGSNHTTWVVSAPVEGSVKRTVEEAGQRLIEELADAYTVKACEEQK